MICWIQSVGIVLAVLAFMLLMCWASETDSKAGAIVLIIAGIAAFSVLVWGIHEGLCPKHKPMHVSVSLPLNPLSSTSGGAA